MSDLSSKLASLGIDRSGDSRGDRNPNRFRPLRYAIAAAVLVAACAVVYVVALPYLESRVFKVEVSVSEILLVSPAQAEIELVSTGYVKAQRTSLVAAKVAGKVSKVLIAQGDQVGEGDVLYELEVTDQQAAIASSKARAAAAWARVRTNQANQAEIELQANRESKLAQQGIRPEANAEDLAARVASLRSQVRAAEADARSAEAEVRALSVTLSSYVVRAPIAGRVLGEPPELGEIVGPQSAAEASGGLGSIEIADFATLAVETDVPESRLHMVSVGGPCEIVLDAFPSKRYRGKVLEIVPRVNRAKATVAVKVSFLDAADGVLPDMAARVSFLAKELDAAAMAAPPRLIVPAAAVVDKNGAKIIYVLEDGRVRMIPVTVGDPQAAGLELRSGPPAGTRVVKNPPSGLADGQAVKERID